MMNNLELLRKIHSGSNDFFREDDDVVCHIAILRSWLDSEAADDLAYVFDPDDDRFYDRLYTIEPFMDECKRIIDDELEESYFSINSFWRKKKQTDDIRHLNAFALDFDFYRKRRYQSLTPTEMYEKHIKAHLPLDPTAVIDSGRGLYVIYAFHHCSIERLALYRAIYHQFQCRYEQYGMDAMATNVTQVIRIPGSYNAKADKVVEIIDSHDTEYELTDFCKLLPYTYDQVRIHRQKRKQEISQKEKKIKSEEGRKARKKKCRSFLEDLKQLIAIRNHNGIYEGYRELLIYLALEKMLWAGYEKDVAIKTAAELNTLFHWPMKDSEIKKQCMPARIHYHCHSISKVISKLSITPAEQKKLKVIVSRAQRDLYVKNLKNRHPLLNRTRKEVELLIRRTEVVKLKKAGRRNVDIARALDVDKATVTNDLKYIQKNKQEFRRVLGETIEELVRAFNDANLIRKVVYDELKRLRRWAEISTGVLSDP